MTGTPGHRSAHLLGLGLSLPFAQTPDALDAWLRSGDPVPGGWAPERGGIPLPARERRRLDRPSAMALAAAVAAGRWGDGAIHEDVGVALGSLWGCAHTNEALFAGLGLATGGAIDWGEALDPMALSIFKQTVPNAPAAWLAIALGLLGPSVTLQGPGDPGIEALWEALDRIELGAVSGMYAGGVEAWPAAIAAAEGPGVCEGAGVLRLGALPEGRPGAGAWILEGWRGGAGGLREAADGERALTLRDDGRLWEAGAPLGLPRLGGAMAAVGIALLWARGGGVLLAEGGGFRIRR